MNLFTRELLGNNKYIKIVVSAVALIAVMAFLNGKSEMSSENYTFIGRWYDVCIDGEDYKVTNNLGSEIFFKVNGVNNIVLDWKKYGFTSNAYYCVSIDDGDLHRLQIGDNTIRLPDTGEHTIRLITDGVNEQIGKWEEGHGFAFGGCNCQTQAFTLQKPIIAFYGDSITEGVRALGIDNDDMGNTNSATNAFPWYCCEDLEAVSYRVGYGATGIETTGSFNSTLMSVRYYYEGTPVDDNIQPDLIVINIGTNDDPTESFEAGYSQLLDEIHNVYHANVVCMVPFNQSHLEEIENCVAVREWCYLVRTDDWDLDYVDGIHPSRVGGRKAGKMLATLIQDMGLL